MREFEVRYRIGRVLGFLFLGSPESVTFCIHGVLLSNISQLKGSARHVIRRIRRIGSLKVAENGVFDSLLCLEVGLRMFRLVSIS